MPSEAEIEAAAKAVWNEHNPHRPWQVLSGKTADAWSIYKYDATTVLEAAERVREPVVFVTADYFPGPQLRCTVNGPSHIIVEPVGQ